MGANGLKVEEVRVRWDVRETGFVVRVVRHSAEATWRSCGCPITGGIQGQTGWGFEGPDVVIVGMCGGSVLGPHVGAGCPTSFNNEGDEVFEVICIRHLFQTC